MTRRWLPAALCVLPLLAQGPPVIYPGGVVNAAHYGRPIAKGSIASIFGENLAPRTAAAEGFPLPTELAGVKVRVGGPKQLPSDQSEIVVEAPLFFVSPGQINFMVPSGLYPEPFSPEFLEVRNESGVSERVSLPPDITSWALGIFTLDASGCGPPAVLNVAPDGSVSVNSPENSAEPGGALTIFLTGMGVTPVQPPDGEPIPTDRYYLMGGFGAVVGREGYINLPYLRPREGAPLWLFSGKAPGTVGLDQYNLKLPTVMEEGCYVPLRLTAPGGRLFGSQTVYVSVRAGGGRCRDEFSSFGLVKWNVTFSRGGGAVLEVVAEFPHGVGNLQPRFENPEWFSQFVGGGWGDYHDIAIDLAIEQGQPPVSCPDPRARQLLDAGTLTVTGPGLGTADLEREETPNGPRYRGQWTVEEFQPGRYTLQATGGGGVSPFESTIELPAPVTPEFDFPPGTEIDTSKPMTFRWSGGDERSRILIDLDSYRPENDFLSDRWVLIAEDARRGELTYASFAPVLPRRWLLFISDGNQLRFTLRQRTKDESTVEKFSADGLSLGGWQMFEYRWVWDGLIPAPSDTTPPDTG